MSIAPPPPEVVVAPTPAPSPTPTPPTPTVDSTTLLTPPVEVKPPPGWREALPDDLKGHKTLEKFKDVPALAKGYAELEKLLSQRALKPLNDTSSPDDIVAYRKAFGIPEDPAGYFTAGVTRPEIAASGGWSEAAESEFLAAMHAVHAPPAIVQAALNVYAGFEGEKQKAAVRETQAAAQELRREWGPTYDANLGRANRAIQEFGGSDLVDLFERTGAGRTPLVVKAFAKIGNALVESGAMDAEGLAANVTADEARKKVGELRAEMAKLPEGHPRIADMIDEVLALTRVIHRG